ncbi:MAG: hypothetical protein ACI8VT_001160 [Saprospiraceae bacterium]|jgi:hypothetical protein
MVVKVVNNLVKNEGLNKKDFKIINLKSFANQKTGAKLRKRIRG